MPPLCIISLALATVGAARAIEASAASTTVNFFMILLRGDCYVVWTPAKPVCSLNMGCMASVAAFCRFVAVVVLTATLLRRCNVTINRTVEQRRNLPLRGGLGRRWRWRRRCGFRLRAFGLHLAACCGERGLRLRH